MKMMKVRKLQKSSTPSHSRYRVSMLAALFIITAYLSISSSSNYYHHTKREKTGSIFGFLPTNAPNHLVQAFTPIYHYRGQQKVPSILASRTTGRWWCAFNPPTVCYDLAARPIVPWRRSLFHTRLVPLFLPRTKTTLFEQSNEVTNGYSNYTGSETTPSSSKPLSANQRATQTTLMTKAAPEINKWTAIMSNGTNAPVQRPKKKDVKEDPKQNRKKKLVNFRRHIKYMSPYDQAEMEKYWDRLMPNVSYLGSENAAKIKNSLQVAYTAHRSQVRKSGEPFIIHPVEVSLLLCGLQMDAETIMAGLLHDTVEDTELTFEEVQDMFGPVVRNLVEGETKVSKLPTLAFNDYADEQAENLRQMFMAMTDDYRIIIVKLADRLHNMRTLRYMKPQKQLKISRETLDIFAPLAHRMGIWQFKSELEDTAFMYLYPGEYKLLNRRLRRNQKKFRDILDKSQEILKQTISNDTTLKDKAANVEVQGRRKELYSLWYKMKMNGEDLDQIKDIVALRVIIEPKRPELGCDKTDHETDRGVWLCYHVLGLVQHLPGFQPVPTKVKDYISFPKPNGYQSLHTALMLNGQTIEVQIRTSAMHQIAQYGMASHWSYIDEKKRASKRSSIVKDGTHDLYNTPWLSNIKEWQDEMLTSRDFVDCVRRELLGKRVFVFLRNGKILNLSKGATVVDAAFEISTEVGLHMHAVEINGKPVSCELY